VQSSNGGGKFGEGLRDPMPIAQCNSLIVLPEQRWLRRFPLLQAGIPLLDKRLVRQEGSRLPSKAGLLSIFRRHQCLLICGRCGNALATARVGPISLVRVQHATGHDVAPLQGDVAERVAAARVSAAEAAAQQVGRRPEDDLEVLAARHEVEYLRRQVGEIAFDLQCPSCESRYWRSLPHLVKEIRSALANQVRMT
jgi:hypothetical protein